MKRFLPIIIGMLIAGIAAFVYFKVINKPPPPAPTQIQAEAKKTAATDKKARMKDKLDGPVMALGEAFTVNLADPGAFVRTEIAVKVDAGTPMEAGAGGHGGGDALPLEEQAEIRDIVIDVLSQQKAGESVTSEGRAKIKEQIIERINEETHKTIALDVFFNSYAVQTGV